MVEEGVKEKLFEPHLNTDSSLCVEEGVEGTKRHEDPVSIEEGKLVCVPWNLPQACHWLVGQRASSAVVVVIGWALVLMEVVVECRVCCVRDPGWADAQIDADSLVGWTVELVTPQLKTKSALVAWYSFNFSDRHYQSYVSY